jgi:UDP-N-acetylmuramyl tripeptide synthase
VDPSITVVPPPFNADHPPQGLSFDLAVGTPDSTKLTVSFTGATKPGNQACGADYTAEAVESDLAVVVIVVEHANPLPASCAAVGKTRTAIATLAAPLGKRAVLEVTQGLPVPIHAP